MAGLPRLMAHALGLRTAAPPGDLRARVIYIKGGPLHSRREYDTFLFIASLFGGFVDEVRRLSDQFTRRAMAKAGSRRTAQGWTPLTYRPCVDLPGVRLTAQLPSRRDVAGRVRPRRS